jgi:fructoselysine-6-P-deglycase FrlB-like protein
MASPRLAVLTFEGPAATAPLNQNLARELAAAGARGGLVGPSAHCDALRLPEVDPIALPLLEILPAQMASIALAARAGSEPGKFTRATKITTTE